MTASTSPIRLKLLNACLGFLIPTARFLIRGGISCNEFLNLARLAFVAAAARDYGTRGREANSSRIAVLTGLSRRDVGRLRVELKNFDEDARTRLTPIGDILQRWYTDREYLNEDGRPVLLETDGPRPSFESLVHDVLSADFPVLAMRSELIRAGLADETTTGRLRPLSRNVVPKNAEEKLISALTYGLRAHVETIAFNTDPDRTGPSRIERFVEGPRLSVADREVAQLRIRKLLAGYATKIDDEFSELEVQQAPSGGKRVGVGFYYFEE